MNKRARPSIDEILKFAGEGLLDQLTDSESDETASEESSDEEEEPKSDKKSKPKKKTKKPPERAWTVAEEYELMELFRVAKERHDRQTSDVRGRSVFELIVENLEKEGVEHREDSEYKRKWAKMDKKFRKYTKELRKQTGRGMDDWYKTKIDFYYAMYDVLAPSHKEFPSENCTLTDGYAFLDNSSVPKKRAQSSMASVPTNKTRAKFFSNSHQTANAQKRKSYTARNALNVDHGLEPHIEVPGDGKIIPLISSTEVHVRHDRVRTCDMLLWNTKDLPGEPATSEPVVGIVKRRSSHLVDIVLLDGREFLKVSCSKNMGYFEDVAALSGFDCLARRVFPGDIVEVPSIKDRKRLGLEGNNLSVLCYSKPLFFIKKAYKVGSGLAVVHEKFIQKQSRGTSSSGSSLASTEFHATPPFEFPSALHRRYHITNQYTKSPDSRKQTSNASDASSQRPGRTSANLPSQSGRTSDSIPQPQQHASSGSGLNTSGIHSSESSSVQPDDAPNEHGSAGDGASGDGLDAIPKDVALHDAILNETMDGLCGFVGEIDDSQFPSKVKILTCDQRLINMDRLAPPYIIRKPGEGVALDAQRMEIHVNATVTFLEGTGPVRNVSNGYVLVDTSAYHNKKPLTVVVAAACLCVESAVEAGLSDQAAKRLRRRTTDALEERFKKKRRSGKFYASDDDLSSHSSDPTDSDNTDADDHDDDQESRGFQGHSQKSQETAGKTSGAGKTSEQPKRKKSKTRSVKLGRQGKASKNWRFAYSKGTAARHPGMPAKCHVIGDTTKVIEKSTNRTIRVLEKYLVKSDEADKKHEVIEDRYLKIQEMQMRAAEMAAENEKVRKANMEADARNALLKEQELKLKIRKLEKDLGDR